MKLPKYVRVKTAKGKRPTITSMPARTSEGKRALFKLPDIRDPRFGGALARAQATRTNQKNRQGTLTLDGLIRAYEKSPEFDMLAESTKRSYSRYLALANKLLRDKAETHPLPALS
jgi:hypothetical protein